MRNLGAAISFFILVAVLGCQAGIIQETIREKRREIHHYNPQAVQQGVQDASDCCFSYVSRIPCSRFIYYFPTSGGCIKPGIIFVARRRNQVCANPSDRRVQECIQRLRQIPRPGNRAIA
ncbi:C-C motif chemokine 6-like [Cricetulus griseus]|uniref:C-C motif chemokine n=1 Tax=Cricetulus griseus TaxID=10029 RepID=A0A3L7GLJ2_CRIGR|nr:C-C motif chemokine 6-like [Cricetulus griseus]XP_027282249.1 C-C motif chemokine 6-like [Cricetulus griseus]